MIGQPKASTKATKLNHVSNEISNHERIVYGKAAIGRKGFGIFLLLNDRKRTPVGCSKIIKISEVKKFQ
jgi:hypothetical protein